MKKCDDVGIQAIENNRTWKVVNMPKGKKPIGCKWVFTIQYKTDGIIKKHKTILVTKSYTQIEGINYQEIFAPVANINTI